MQTHQPASPSNSSFLAFCLILGKSILNFFRFLLWSCCEFDCRVTWFWDEGYRGSYPWPGEERGEGGGVQSSNILVLWKGSEARWINCWNIFGCSEMRKKKKLELKASCEENGWLEMCFGVGEWFFSGVAQRFGWGVHKTCVVEEPVSVFVGIIGVHRAWDQTTPDQKRSGHVLVHKGIVFGSSQQEKNHSEGRRKRVTIVPEQSEL